MNSNDKCCHSPQSIQCHIILCGIIVTREVGMNLIAKWPDAYANHHRLWLDGEKQMWSVITDFVTRLREWFRLFLSSSLRVKLCNGQSKEDQFRLYYATVLKPSFILPNHGEAKKKMKQNIQRNSRPIHVSPHRLLHSQDWVLVSYLWVMSHTFHSKATWEKRLNH